MDYFPGFAIHEENVLMCILLRVLGSCEVLMASQVIQLGNCHIPENFKPKQILNHCLCHSADKCALLYPLEHQTNENNVGWIQQNQEFLNTFKTTEFVSIRMPPGTVKRKLTSKGLKG